MSINQNYKFLTDFWNMLSLETGGTEFETWWHILDFILDYSCPGIALKYLPYLYLTNI